VAAPASQALVSLLVDVHGPDRKTLANITHLVRDGIVPCTLGMVCHLLYTTDHSISRRFGNVMVSAEPGTTLALTMCPACGPIGGVAILPTLRSAKCSMPPASRVEPWLLSS